MIMLTGHPNHPSHRPPISFSLSFLSNWKTTGESYVNFLRRSAPAVSNASVAVYVLFSQVTDGGGLLDNAPLSPKYPHGVRRPLQTL